ncbi:MAG: hypothetical protein SGARI_002264, partial [Bacillariaceae sp.]
MVVTDRKQIARHYLSHWFWVDLIGIFPFYVCIIAARGEVGVDNQATRNLQLIRLLRVTRLHRVFHAFEVTQYSTKISLMWYTMTRNFGFSLLWTHFAACMMYFISRQHDFQDSWLEEPAPTETNVDLYLTSLYWSIVTFTTVGYGDFSPVNAAEQVFGMFYMFCNMVIASWIIGSITLLVVKGDEKNGEFRSNLQLLDEYATLNNFDEGIRKRLKTQLKLDFNSREVSDENVLQHFPGTLRRKVIRQLYYPTLSNTNLMKNVRQMFVDSFLTSCSVELFGPGEELVQRGNIPNDLYLIVDGTVKVSTSTYLPSESFDKNGNSVTGGSIADSDARMSGGPVLWREIGAGGFINDIAFFTESPCVETIRTTSICKTLTMPKHVYKAIAGDHPGSVSIILENLLSKARTLAKSQGKQQEVKLSRRLEYLKAGSTFNIVQPGSPQDSKEDTSEIEVDDTIEQAQAQATLTNVEDLINIHINKLKDDHTTRFLFAASREDLPTLRLMLNNGIDPDSADYDRRNALMVSSMNGNSETVSLLLEHHANPNMTDVHGTTALYEAVKGNHIECMKILQQHGGDMCLSEDAAATKLCQCVFDGDIVMLSRLCQAGIDVNAGDYDRRTAIHIAASEGNMAAIKVLVKSGADLNVRDRWNQNIEDEAKSAKATM